MKTGRHAAEDGSFGRSAGMAAGRGAALLAVAVLLGVVALQAADDTPPERVAADDRTPATRPRNTTTSSRPSPTTAPVRPPREVKVLSANGTTVRGAAGRVRDTLRAKGYNVLAPGDAQRTDTTSVFSTPGYEREAEAVAQVLDLPAGSVKPLPSPPPTEVRGANVVVVVGLDLARRPTTTTRPRSTTTTRSRPTSTTTQA